MPPGTATTAASSSKAILSTEKTRFSTGTSAARRMPVSTKSWITKIDHSGVAITKNTISGRWPAASRSSVGPQVGTEREHRPGERRRHAAHEVTADDQPPRHPPATGTKRRSA